MKRFVIGTNRTTAEQDSAFLNILRSRWPHLGWWHQVSETWLIVDLANTVTVVELRDAAMQAFPGIYIMVIEVNGSWAGWGANSPPGDMFTWMRDSWDREE